MQINVNGKVLTVDSEPDTPLLWVLRDELGLTGTKYGCGVQQCGACTVLVDGEAMRSCGMTLDSVGDSEITTIEAIEEDAEGQRVVKAWVEHQVPQCGYCQSGQVLTATALLKWAPTPTEEDIESAMINLCRCGTYNAISAAVKTAAEN